METGVEKLLAHDACCAVVRLRLDDPAHTSWQSWLTAKGFRLTAILPPKRTWVGTGHMPLSTPAYGFWSKPNMRHSVVQSFYFKHAGRNAEKKIILAYPCDMLRWH